MIKLVDKQLNLAFKVAKDFAKEVTFNLKALEFNFGDSSVTTSNTDITSKIIDVKSEKVSKDNTITKKTIMFKRKEVGDINAYDTLTCLDGIWKIGSVVKDNGFIGVVDIYKEL